VVDQERLVGRVLNGQRDAVAVLLAARQRPKDEEVERPLEDRRAFRSVLVVILLESTAALVDCQPNRERLGT
jgi:hypothetical protein